MNTTEPLNDTVPALLAHRCETTPQATAYLEEVGPGKWRATDWQTFGSQIHALRRALNAAKLRRGDRLALIAPVSLRWECLHHAALSLGVAVVGLDAHDLPERIADMAEQADVTAMVVGSLQAVAKVDPARLLACKLLVCLEAKAAVHGPMGRWKTWAELEQLAIAKPAATDDEVCCTDLATIIFTSGTTGAPKGIAYTHGQVSLAVAAIGDAFRFVGPESRLLCWLPLSNLFQRMVNLAAIRQGVSTYLLADPRRVMDVVSEVSPDIFIGVPRFFEKLHAGLLDNLARQPPLKRALVRVAWAVGRRWRTCERTAKRPPIWLALLHPVVDNLVLQQVRAVMGSRIRCMISGSAPMPLHLLEEMHALGWLVLESYGLSENIVPMTMNLPDQFRLGSVGRPVKGNYIRLDNEGNIQVRGPGVFQGYIGETAGAPLDAQGWYRTGDLGCLDAAGYLTLTGRTSDLIKTSTGRRIAPAGVEAILRSIPGIDHALVLGSGRKCLVAICTCSGATSAEQASRSLTGLLRARLADLSAYERPGAIAFLPVAFSIEQGELTPNLKLRRDVIEGRHATLVSALYVAVDAGRSSRPDILVLN